MALYRDAASAVLRLHCLAKEITWHSSSLYPGNNTPPSPQSQNQININGQNGIKRTKLELIENSYAFSEFQFQQSHSPYDLYLYSIVVALGLISFQVDWDRVKDNYYGGSSTKFRFLENYCNSIQFQVSGGKGLFLLNNYRTIKEVEPTQRILILT